VFEPNRGDFTGALMLAQGALFVTAGVTYVALAASHMLPMKVLNVALVVFLLVGPIFLYRFAKGAWIGILHGVAHA
jgi:hypothetical protein